MQSSNNILETIIARKKQIVAEKKLRFELAIIQDKIKQGHAPALRPFQKALKNNIAKHDIAIIAELKKASPSKGVFCPDYHPDKLAAEYEKHHATCLSVLTDNDFFFGTDEDLKIARENCSLPILRKDFIIDDYQIYESRLIGADCILLIAAVLSKDELKTFFELATSLELDVLFEITNETELANVLELNPKLIGVNNRNLRDFKINLDTTISLRKKIPDDKIVICESGIKQRSDIDQMLQNNIHAFLIGEAIVKAPHPGEKLDELLGRT